MNKIKVLYDVVKTMKEKEIINGVINFQVTKNEINVVSFNNEFHKDNISGDVKAKISKEINTDGKKIRQQTEVEFNTKNCHHHKFLHGMHGMHKHNHEHLDMKVKLSKAAFILNILNNLEADNKEDKIVLSLNLKEVIKECKELKTEFQKNLNDIPMDKSNGTCPTENMKGPHNHHEFFKQFLCEEYKDAVLNVIINKNNEVEKIKILANGEKMVNGSLIINY